MAWVELQPTAPLSLGTGKPMGFGLGGDSRTFPLPSVTAGALRAAAAVAQGMEPNPELEAVVHLAVGAPRLVRRGPGEAVEHFLPCPTDLLAVSSEAGGRLVPLRPQALPRGGATDVTELHSRLELPYPAERVKAKPIQVPMWWRTDLILKWLQYSTTVSWPGYAEALNGPRLDQRTHVGIDPLRGGPEPSMLFRSSGADFGGRRQELAAGRLEQFSVGVAWQGPKLDGVQRRVGGEGRACHVRHRTTGFGPDRPRSLDAVKQGQRFRLLLTSPAVFAEGWLPDGLDAKTLEGKIRAGQGPCVRLVSAALPRTMMHSGWVGGKPGQPWRVVPAGTVYWCEALEEIPGEALWQRSLCAEPWAGSGWGEALWGRA